MVRNGRVKLDFQPKSYCNCKKKKSISVSNFSLVTSISVNLIRRVLLSFLSRQKATSKIRTTARKKVKIDLRNICMKSCSG